MKKQKRVTVEMQRKAYRKLRIKNLKKLLKENGVKFNNRIMNLKTTEDKAVFGYKNYLYNLCLLNNLIPRPLPRF